MIRQIFVQPASTPEEANRRNFLPVTSGNIWYRTDEVARIESGNVVSLVTNQKVANLDAGGSLRSLDGEPLYIQLEIVNGGGRIPAETNRDASPSNIQGGSRMREFRPYGSVRGALSNGRPYRDIYETRAGR
jgi:hypothetical protein